MYSARGLGGTTTYVLACTSCVLSKMHRMVNKGPATTKALRPLHRVHFDFAFAPAGGVRGYIGFLLLIDEFTGKIDVYLIHSKAELPGILHAAIYKAELGRGTLQPGHCRAGMFSSHQACWTSFGW